MSAATSTAIPPLKSRGKVLDTSPSAFGFLADSSTLLGDGAAMRSALERDGYLYLPGALNRETVAMGRADVCRRLAAGGLFDSNFAPNDGVLRADSPNPYFRPDVTDDNEPLLAALYSGRMAEIFEAIFDGPIRHFDYTWFRAVGPGKGTSPHCDVVYMGRGTRELLTAWTPFGDIPLEMGGLIVLENSHRRRDLTGEYLAQDVDSYCENGPGAGAIQAGKLHWEHYEKPGEPWDGAISDDPPALRARFGTRWLTAPEYRMGDVLIFTMATIHASLDNATNRIRLSSDTRYQSADAPIDERWVNGPNGEKPINHTLAAKRGRVC